jgi:hypothetical protein
VDECQPCPPIRNSRGNVNCNSNQSVRAVMGQFECLPEFFLVNGPIRVECQPCLPIKNSRGPITCKSSQSSRGTKGQFACNAGYFIDTSGQADVCRPCAATTFSSGLLTCQDSSTSKGVEGRLRCDSDYYWARGRARDSCLRMCRPYPMAGIEEMACLNTKFEPWLGNMPQNSRRPFRCLICFYTNWHFFVKPARPSLVLQAFVSRPGAR